jgi:CRISPR type II-A-associated protein Csn2
MKMLLSNYENDLEFDNYHINTIEILDKKAFYQFLKDINNINIQDNISFIEKGELVNIQSKISIIYNYINFEFDNKKIINNILDKINSNLDEKDEEEINKIYKKLKSIYTNIIKEIDLELEIEEDFSIQDISKMMKPRIVNKNNLIDNLLLLIDIESELKIDELIIFVNLKGYLDNEELTELYKYAIYKNINILLIDNNKYITNKFEKKLLIDEDLIEFML